MIHLLKDQRWDRSTLVVTTRCGATLTRKTTERLEGATVWDSQITCPECRP